MPTGTIAAVDIKKQCGSIHGDDGRRLPFEREGMVLWLQFLELKPGMPVRYDVESNGAAINVERVMASNT